MTIRSETNEEEVKKRLEMFKKRFLEKGKTIMQEHCLLLIDHLRSKYMRGANTTDTSIRRRSGNLANSMRSLPVKASLDKIEGGISFGKVYAKVHIGPRGQVTTIKPKNKDWLTVPIPWSPIFRNDGTLKATAAELKEGKAGLPFGDTFIKKSRQGFFIIWGTKRITKGKRLGQYEGEIIPLFVLAKKVKVKARIHPEDFLKWSKEQLVKDFKKKGIDASISYG